MRVVSILSSSAGHIETGCVSQFIVIGTISNNPTSVITECMRYGKFMNEFSSENY